jgi:hypothetical protein
LLWIESLIAAAICNLIIRDQIVGKKEQTLHGTVATASWQKQFDSLMTKAFVSRAASLNFTRQNGALTSDN